MSKQKSMGRVAFESGEDLNYNPRRWNEIGKEWQGLWEKTAQAVIAEHERRKRAKRRGKK